MTGPELSVELEAIARALREAEERLFRLRVYTDRRPSVVASLARVGTSLKACERDVHGAAEWVRGRA